MSCFFNQQGGVGREEHMGRRAGDGWLAGTGTMTMKVTVVDEDVVVGSDRALAALDGCQAWVVYLSGSAL